MFTDSRRVWRTHALRVDNLGGGVAAAVLCADDVVVAIGAEHLHDLRLEMDVLLERLAQFGKVLEHLGSGGVVPVVLGLAGGVLR